jgi:hypothetical protein
MLNVGKKKASMILVGYGKPLKGKPIINSRDYERT